MTGIIGQENIRQENIGQENIGQENIGQENIGQENIGQEPGQGSRNRLIVELNASFQKTIPLFGELIA